MPKPPVATRGIDPGSHGWRFTGIAAWGALRSPISGRKTAMKTATKTGMNNRTLKNHLKYIVPEIRLALIKEPGGKPQSLTGPEDLERFVEPLKHYDTEHFVSFHLDAKNQVIGYQIVSHGTLTASLVHPREVFKAALIGNSNSIIVAHNHPAGTLKPSSEDIDTTKILIKAGDLLGVKVLDHIIVSHSGCVSLREMMPRLWE
jgi:DNA repair protein RadC